MPQPVRLRVEMPPPPRDRIRALLRPILIIPHLLLVGGAAFGFLGVGVLRTGALGAVAWLCALFDWFAILIGGRALPGLRPLKRTYLAWRARVLAYGAFLVDPYPPFGEGDYPVTLDLPGEPEPRDQIQVLLRPLLILPHLVWLLALLFVWIFAGFFSWIALSITGALPDSVWRFSRDVMDYSLRVEAYGLLIHDTFPSFALGAAPETQPG